MELASKVFCQKIDYLMLVVNKFETTIFALFSIKKCPSITRKDSKFRKIFSQNLKYSALFKIVGDLFFVWKISYFGNPTKEKI